MLGILFSALCSLLTPNVVRFGKRKVNTITRIWNIHNIGRHNKVVTANFFHLFYGFQRQFSFFYPIFRSLICFGPWLDWFNGTHKNQWSHIKTADSNGLIVLRIFSGLGEGTMYAGLTDLLAAWVPLKERTTLASLAYGGSTVKIEINFLTGH